ncbi:hypothetical protein MTR_0138s0070 [Medicago truncatula]|uniref:Uncharacterized protein n=1 Tax=Medicago truncatula TaxID=3880 RepID=A0A072TSQ3_MEDTR|nr:hypothetical protein MTR_0138s0070 [Medicago truncatula]
MHNVYPSIQTGRRSITDPLGERIFDGLSLGAKERGFGADLVRKYEDLETKIYFPQVRNLARPVLGLARPCHTPELLLLRF